jgi:hypothetical protein
MLLLFKLFAPMTSGWTDDDDDDDDDPVNATTRSCGDDEVDRTPTCFYYPYLPMSPAFKPPLPPSRHILRGLFVWRGCALTLTLSRRRSTGGGDSRPIRSFGRCSATPATVALESLMPSLEGRHLRGRDAFPIRGESSGDGMGRVVVAAAAEGEGQAEEDEEEGLSWEPGKTNSPDGWET